jgi:hypothetical protein
VRLLFGENLDANGYKKSTPDEEEPQMLGFYLAKKEIPTI